MTPPMDRRRNVRHWYSAAVIAPIAAALGILSAVWSWSAVLEKRLTIIEVQICGLAHVISEVHHTVDFPTSLLDCKR